VSSTKEATYTKIREFSPLVITLQETRKSVESTASYTFFNLVRNEGEYNHGGGIAIGTHKTLNSRQRDDLVPEIMKDIETLIVQSVNQVIEIYTICMYVSPATKKKFYNIRKYINNWILTMYF
jgi:hypothetical protein